MRKNKDDFFCRSLQGESEKSEGMSVNGRKSNIRAVTDRWAGNTYLAPHRPYPFAQYDLFRSLNGPRLERRFIQVPAS